ncbi:MAG TPA: hypothetical protein VGL35_11415 [Rhizomicrobium sp.]|jgi:hypothetical protein
MRKFSVWSLVGVGLAACSVDPTAPPTPALGDACATVLLHPSYSVMLQGGPGKIAIGTIDFAARGIHHNVQLMINSEPITKPFDIVVDPCTVDRSGNAVFSLHPPVPTDPTQVDLKDGDKWTFSLPPPGANQLYAITDTTGMSLGHPVTPGWTGYAKLPPPPGEASDEESNNPLAH